MSLMPTALLSLLSIMAGTVVNGTKDTTKRQAQVINFFVLVTRELDFFKEANDVELVAWLEAVLYESE